MVIFMIQRKVFYKLTAVFAVLLMWALLAVGVSAATIPHYDYSSFRARVYDWLLTPGNTGTQFYEKVDAVHQMGYGPDSKDKTFITDAPNAYLGNTGFFWQTDCKSHTFNDGTYYVYFFKMPNLNYGYWYMREYQINVRVRYVGSLSYSGAPEGYGGIIQGGQKVSTVEVKPGESTTVEVVTVPGHKYTVSCSGASYTVSGNNYTFTNVNSNFSFSVMYEADQFAKVSFASSEASITVNGSSASPVSVISGIPYTVNVTVPAGKAIASITVDGTPITVSHSRNVTFTSMAGANGATHVIAVTVDSLSIELHDTATMNYDPSKSIADVIKGIFNAVYKSSTAPLNSNDVSTSYLDSKSVEVRCYSEGNFQDLRGNVGIFDTPAHVSYMSGKMQVRICVYNPSGYSNECLLTLINGNITAGAITKDYTGKPVSLSKSNGADFSWTSSATSHYISGFTYFDSAKNQLASAPAEPGSYYVRAALYESWYNDGAILPYLTTNTFSDFVPLTINGVGLTVTDIKDISGSKTYDGSAVSMSFTVVVSGTENVDWRFDGGVCANFPFAAPVYQYKSSLDTEYINGLPAYVGTYTIKITVGSVSKTAEITVSPKIITEDMVTADTTVPTSPIVTVKDGERTLVLSSDYTLTLPSDLVNAGQKTLTVNGVHNYGGTVTKSWEIPRQNYTTEVDIVGWTYGENANSPFVTANPENGKVNYYYKKTTDSDAAYSTAVPTAAGEYTVKAEIEATQNYNAASDTKNFTISKKAVTAVVTAAEKTYDRNSSATVSAVVQQADLVAGDSITISGVFGNFDNENAGDAKTVYIDSSSAVITGADNYTVTIPASTVGSIFPRSLTSAEISVQLNDELYYYDGNEKSPVVIVTYDGTVIASGTDYNIDTAASVTAATVPGGTSGYTVTVEGNGNFKDRVSKNWNILKGIQTGISASDVNVEYDGNAHYITVNGVGSGGTVYYGSSSDSCSSAAPITATGVGDSRTVWYKVVREHYDDYIGSASITVTPAKITVTPDAGQNKTFGENDPASFTFSHSGAKNGEIPGFSGALVRAAGENADSYLISAGSIALSDNQSFIAANYTLEFSSSPVYFKINKAASSVTIADGQSVVYDGKAIDAGSSGTDILYSFVGDGTVTVKWYDENGTELASAPTRAGKYKIGISVSEGTNYLAASELVKDIEIEKRELEITAKPQSIVYGNDIEKAVSVVEAIPAPGDILESITVSANALTVKEGKQIILSGAVIKDGTEDVTDCYDIKYTAGALTVAKADMQAPAAPAASADKITSSSVELTAAALPAGYDGTAEYAVNTENTAPADDSAWGDNVFSALDKATVYYFFVRYSGDDNYNRSPASAGSAVTTLNTYTVSYDLNGGVGTLPAAVTKDMGKSFEAAQKGDIAKRGYSFIGWSSNENAKTAEFDFGSVYTLNADDTLYAVWQINQYSITFDSNGGSAVAKITEDYDTPVSKPADPTKAGYDFGGWKKADGTDFTFTNFRLDAESFTLKAEWIPRGDTAYTVNHYIENLDGGYSLESVVGYGTTDTLTAASQKVLDGFTAAPFVQTEIIGDGSAEVDIYYARKTYTVRFIPGNGKPDIEKFFKFGEAITLPEAPERDGWTFAGWGTIPAVMPHYNLAYTAKWNANDYTVTLNAGIGRIYSGKITGYVHGTGAVLPTNVIASGFVFAGWYTDPELKNGPVAEITPNDIGNKEFWAKWTPIFIPPVRSYTVGVIENVGGDVSVSKNIAYKSERVEISVTPEKGFELSTISVIADGGAVVGYNKVSDGVYSFNMPMSNVAVSAVFTAKDPTVCPKDHSCPIHGYSDIDTAAWYHDGVHFCLDNRLFIGYEDNTFRPDIPTSRAMIVTILWRIEGSPKVSSAVNFKDVDPREWYTDAVRWAASKGIVLGHDNGTFTPETDITREQLAAILWRYCKYKGVDISAGENTKTLSFDDASAISDWAVPAVKWACAEDVLDDMISGRIEPARAATRAEAAAAIYAACENILK